MVNTGIGGFAAVIEVPLPKNASTGQMVEFTCAVSNSKEIITWDLYPTNGQHLHIHVIKNTTNLFGGGERSVIHFLAVTEIEVRCFITNTTAMPHTTTIERALLLVQGKQLATYFIIKILL